MTDSYTATGPAAANATVLVVGNEARTRQRLRARLAAEGCHVLEAMTGAAALEQLGDTIDVVLLDQQLPDADGLEWLRTAHDQQPDVPVIMLSAQTTVDYAVDAVKRGAFHYAASDRRQPRHADAARPPGARRTGRTRRRVVSLLAAAG